MVSYFSGNELLEIAVGIERNGFAFYQGLADKTPDEAAKAVYSFLAREEKKHENMFLGLGGSLPKFEPPESYPGEFMLYLKSLVDSLVFQNLGQAAAATRLKKDVEAVNRGIQAEKDSILFYGEVAQMVRAADRGTVTRILEEEKGHLRQLAGLKSSILMKSGA